jgi:hypothetical protein
MGCFHPIGRVDSDSRRKPPKLRQIDSPPLAHSPIGRPPGRVEPMSPPDPILAQIVARFDDLDVAPSRGGYTLHDRRTGSAVARIKPIPNTDRFELFYWSLAREAWRTFGDFGRLKLTLDRAHEIFHAEHIFRIQTRR